MTDLKASVETLQREFVDQLDNLGFRPETPAGPLSGVVSSPSGPRHVAITMHPYFPYIPPMVTTQTDTPIRSWHLDRSGGLCLYTEADANSEPWIDARAFVARIESWFEQEAAGWPDDLPSLDADRYVSHVSEAGLTVLYDDLDPMLGHYVKLTHVPGTIRPAKLVRPSNPRTKPPSRTPSKGEHYAWVQDIGEMTQPVRNWDDLHPLLDDSDGLEAIIRAGRARFLILRYHRQGHTGVLAVEAVIDGDGQVKLESLPAASTAISDLRFRSGPAFAVLQDKRVAVVGVGAVGSFTADLLARTGVGHLTLRDGDTLLPGNLVRHLCEPTYIGLNKAVAVAVTVNSRQPQLDPHAAKTPEIATANANNLWEPSEAAELIAQFDLVIDATASGSATMLLRDAARAAGRHCLSVCLVDDGAVARVDILPPLTGDPLPQTPESTVDAKQSHFENGCDDPISPTPPDAVVLAAALTTKHAVALLIGQPLHPAGEIVDRRSADL